MKGGTTMKRCRRTITILIVALLLGTMVQPAFATANFTRTTDLYANEEVERVNIEGTLYSFHYYYENGNRAISVVNEENGDIDNIVYDIASDRLFYNQCLVSAENMTTSPRIVASSDDWETISSDSHYISWSSGTTSAVIAAMIAVYLGTLGTTGVIAAMGMGALGVLASACSGGTLYVELQCLEVPLSNPLHRFVWSFTANTGDVYGSYISHVTIQ